MRGAAVEVFANGVPIRRIVLDLRAYNLGPAPFPLIGYHAQQPTRERVRRVVQNRQGQMFHSFGLESVRLTPEGQSNVSIRIAADLAPGRSIGREIGRGRGVGFPTDSHPRRARHSTST